MVVFCTESQKLDGRAQIELKGPYLSNSNKNHETKLILRTVAFLAIDWKRRTILENSMQLQAC